MTLAETPGEHLCIARLSRKTGLGQPGHGCWFSLLPLRSLWRKGGRSPHYTIFFYRILQEGVNGLFMDGVSTGGVVQGSSSLSSPDHNRGSWHHIPDY